jgi:hypothetical protein
MNLLDLIAVEVVLLLVWQIIAIIHLSEIWYDDNCIHIG